jgi:hypothetical protein
MKISYRTHPVLEKIYSKTLGKLACTNPEDYKTLEQSRDYMRKMWSVSAEDFGKNIQYITKPFSDAIHNAMPKMTSGELIDEALHRQSSGTLLWDKSTFCYSNDVVDGKVSTIYFHFVTLPTGDVTLNAFTCFLGEGEGIKGRMVAYLAKEHMFKNDEKFTIQAHNTNLIATLNFIKYAPVETRNLPPLGKTKEIVCKYVNDTRCKIQILDSTWFTNLVKSDAFKVRGHFRLQPKKKDGEWTKELIWINDFQKEGYTRRAGKVIANEEAA